MSFKLSSPFCLVRGLAICDRCGLQQEVVALGGWTRSDLGSCTEHPVLACMIHQMPAPLLQEIQARHPQFDKRSYGLTQNQYMNFCTCGAGFEDFYLHCEPDGAFCVMSANDARRLKPERLELEGTFSLSCAIGEGWFLRNAIRPHPAEKRTQPSPLRR